MTKLDEWAATVGRTLGLAELTGEERERVLDLARDVAHGVMRPAAPLSTYLLGVAVGRGAEPGEAAATISALAAEWPTDDE